MNTLKKLQAYMGTRRLLLPLSMILAVMSSLLSLLPFLLTWFIIRELLFIDGSTDMQAVYFYAWWAVITALLGVLFYFLALSLSHLAAFRAEVNIRREAMRKIMKLPLGFIISNTSGRIRKIIDDNASVTHSFLAHQLPDLMGTVLSPLAVLVMIFVFDWRLGLVSLLPVIIAFALLSFMMGGKGRTFMKSYMNSLEEMNTEAVEYVRGIPVVKVFQQSVFSFKNFLNSITRYKDMVSAYTRLWKNPMSAYVVMINAFVFVLVPVTIILISMGEPPKLIILDMLLFVLLTPVFGMSIMKSMYLNQALGLAKEAVERIEELVDHQPLPAVKHPQQIKTFDIEFENVSFCYPDSSEKAIDRISFRIPQGGSCALVGPSGSGKTTIARLLPRFWDVGSGAVKIGGVDIRMLDANDLMQHISFVFQDAYLFKTTLKENVIMGRPGAPDHEVERALEMAQCKDIVGRLPDGLDTRIGADGTYLSGGEKQRLALARAILKDAPIIVLDEATAFADPENEHLIRRALSELTLNKTVLMIAHRLSTISQLDQILVVDNGRIVQRGTQRELLAQNGLYKLMWSEYQQSVQWAVGKEVQYA